MSGNFYPPILIYQASTTPVILPIEDNCDLVFTVQIGQPGDTYTLLAAIHPTGILIPSDIYVNYTADSQDIACNAGLFAILVSTVGPLPIKVEYKITRSLS